MPTLPPGWTLPSLRAIATYAAVALAAVVVYELVRSRLKDWLRRRLRRSAEAFIRRHDIRVDRFKLSNETYVKAELLNDLELQREMAFYAQERRLLLDQVREDVEKYIEEIVPFFSYIAYYRLARPIARFVLGLIYKVVVDEPAMRAVQARIPDNAVAVYVMNHKSNVDYVLAAHMLIREVALSYAVGEWARVWPLEALFKSFGSYFLRRGFRDPLYHAVLRKYVQLISLRGVTQGFFPEGRLTRDGALGPAKVGLLDYIVTILQDEAFHADVLFVPVGLNFDTVLEDRALVGEMLRGKDAPPPGLRDKLVSLLRLVVLGPFVLAY
ncbi:MAG TPA: 1-acyl-sn-glycerol-3-phosphate acyltransferase, partial [Myxococcota bacterium]|nr:1-acyl-sn-glycerol-3-phosphate acyltransferase [Myxococcota bacterium]